MMKDVELLQYIHKTAEMGIEGLQNVERQIRDGALRDAVDRQEAEYREISRASGDLLRAKGEDPRDPGLMAKLSSEVMSVMQTMADPSDSKIAEMVIQGNNMGITKSLKHLHDYQGDDPKVRGLAEKLLKTEQDNVEEMKPFL
mgnify:CR=1 FL=1